MSIPTDQIPATPVPSPDYTFRVSGGNVVPPSVIETDANNPSWDVYASLSLWLISVLAVFLMTLIVILPYYLLRLRGVANPAKVMATDPTVALLTVIGVFSAHLVTFGAAWAIVTQWGRRPFWRSIGWEFGPRWGFLPSAGLAIGLYFVGTLLVKLIGGGPTDVDALVESTLVVRITLALVATTSGPLVEEIVYRGVLYPALQRRIGMARSVALVSVLFALVHFWQYRNSIGVLTAILVLSVSLTLVRAFTGRLLPCFIIHMVFNGIISVLIVFQPYFAQFEKSSAPKTGIVMFWRMMQLLT